MELKLNILMRLDLSLNMSTIVLNCPYPHILYMNVLIKISYIYNYIFY